jgi:ribosomal protein S18 acetylase RimI-like enzyme
VTVLHHGRVTVRELEIRRAERDDARAIATVHVRTWRAAYRGLIADDYLDALTVKARLGFWEEWLSLSGERRPYVFVAESPGAGVIGFAAGGPTHEAIPQFDAELYAIYILPEAQGRGVGERLVRTLSAALLEAGYHALLVWVLAANPARRFYERLGAQRLTERAVTVGEHEYPEVSYGWPQLRALA